MSRSGKEKIDEMRRELEKKKNQKESDQSQLTEEEIKKVIEDIAGLDERTVNKYWKKLKERDIIHYNNLEDDSGNKLYYVDGFDPLKKQVKPEELRTEKKTVNLKAPKDLLEKADNYGVNKSHVFSIALLKELESLDRLIDLSISDELDKNEIDFIKEIIEKDAHRNANEERRRAIYLKHFDRWNEVHAENIRKKAFQAAVDAGIERKPASLR